MKRICPLIAALVALYALSWYMSQNIVNKQEPIVQTHLPRIIEVVEAKEPEPIPTPVVKVSKVETPTYSGKASYYDYVLKSGWSSKGSDVCAVRDWPRGTYLEVTSGSKTVICKVTDYGPSKAIHPDRIIDLSSHAFQQLSPLSRGVIPVTVKVVTDVNDSTKGNSKETGR